MMRRRLTIAAHTSFTHHTTVSDYEAIDPEILRSGDNMSTMVRAVRTAVNAVTETAYPPPYTRYPWMPTTR